MCVCVGVCVWVFVCVCVCVLTSPNEDWHSGVSCLLAAGRTLYVFLLIHSVSGSVTFVQLPVLCLRLFIGRMSLLLLLGVGFERPAGHWTNTDL